MEIIGIAALGFAALFLAARALGSKTSDNENLKEVLDDVDKTAKARAELRSDAGFAQRLRARFTR